MAQFLWETACGQLRRSVSHITEQSEIVVYFRVIVSHVQQNDLLAYERRLSEGTLNRTDLRKEREVILDLYKHHLNLLLQANIFVYAVTGALLSFVCTHLNVDHIRLILAFPILFSLGFAIFFCLASRNIDNSIDELKRISFALGVHTYPIIEALRIGLLLSAVILFLMAIFVTVGWLLIRQSI